MKSSTRLAIMILLGCVVALVATLCVYTLWKKTVDPAIIGGYAAVLGALVVNGVVAIDKRHPPEAGE